MNQDLALRILRQLFVSGVREFCVCPGARNSPLIALLAQMPGVKCWWHYEERSAAFFALGRIKSTGRPVAVITTSGTAAGELLPAAMEAHYARLPLVLLTADRPRRFRGTGAPQTAEQAGIYGVYVERCLDLAMDEMPTVPDWSRSRPLHINSCFEEPLLDSASPLIRKERQPESPLPLISDEDIRTSPISPPRDELAAVEDFLSTSRYPLVLVSSLRPEDRESVVRFLERLNAPAYLEAPSGIREDARLSRLRVRCGDRILERCSRHGYPVDAILRVGGVPTLRLWRDLENLNGKIPVLSISQEPFSGLSWARVIDGPVALILQTIQMQTGDPSSLTPVMEAERGLSSGIDELLRSEPQSEPGMFSLLSRTIPESSRVYLGNSLPIREWDLAASDADRGFFVGASRGLNGIDGQVSTFLGFTDPSVDNWAVLGDLTALYDLAGPWILSQLPEPTRLTLAVINNRGGKIFERMFPQPEFQNGHSIELSGWARLWNLSYENWDRVPASRPDGGRRIVEIRPDAGATARFWSAYDALCERI